MKTEIFILSVKYLFLAMLFLVINLHRVIILLPLYVFSKKYSIAGDWYDSLRESLPFFGEGINRKVKELADNLKQKDVL